MKIRGGMSGRREYPGPGWGRADFGCFTLGKGVKPTFSNTKEAKNESEMISGV